MAEPSSPARYTYAGPENLRRPIEAALRRVVDPEFAMSVVDLGLVYGVTVTAERVHVLLTMTSAACPVADLIVDDVRDELARAVAPGLGVDVELVWEPAWSADCMSPRARAFMGW